MTPSMTMRFFAFLCMFMLLAGPRFNVLDFNLLFTLLLSIGGLAYLFLSATLPKTLVALNLMLISFFASSCVSSLLSGAQYFESIAHFFRAFLSFWAAFCVVKIYQKIYSDNQSCEAICRSFEVSFFVNSCFVVLVMFVEPVKQFATTQLSQNSKMAALANESVRSVDLVIGGGAVASLIFSAFFVFSFSRFLYKKECVFSALHAFSSYGGNVYRQVGVGCYFVVPNTYATAV
ncbi:MAG: hypothetical protein NVV73_20905 [Cellvibrionaceae bacterium]|nr:hypothetical protein [Cellvibrionaceae bacterium]